ncbi:hypothetical protein Tco_0610698 [Tanacetum coccineum]
MLSPPRASRTHISSRALSFFLSGVAASTQQFSQAIHRQNRAKCSKFPPLCSFPTFQPSVISSHLTVLPTLPLPVKSQSVAISVSQSHPTLLQCIIQAQVPSPRPFTQFTLCLVQVTSFSSSAVMCLFSIYATQSQCSQRPSQIFTTSSSVSLQFFSKVLSVCAGLIPQHSFPQQFSTLSRTAQLQSIPPFQSEALSFNTAPTPHQYSLNLLALATQPIHCSPSPSMLVVHFHRSSPRATSSPSPTSWLHLCYSQCATPHEPSQPNRPQSRGSVSSSAVPRHEGCAVTSVPVKYPHQAHVTSQFSASSLFLAPGCPSPVSLYMSSSDCSFSPHEYVTYSVPFTSSPHQSLRSPRVLVHSDPPHPQYTNQSQSPPVPAQLYPILLPAVPVSSHVSQYLQFLQSVVTSVPFPHQFSTTYCVQQIQWTPHPATLHLFSSQPSVSQSSQQSLQHSQFPPLFSQCPPVRQSVISVPVKSHYLPSYTIHVSTSPVQFFNRCSSVISVHGSLSSHSVKPQCDSVSISDQQTVMIQSLASVHKSDSVLSGSFVLMTVSSYQVVPAHSPVSSMQSPVVSFCHQVHKCSPIHYPQTVHVQSCVVTSQRSTLLDVAATPGFQCQDSVRSQPWHHTQAVTHLTSPVLPSGPRPMQLGLQIPQQIVLSCSQFPTPLPAQQQTVCSVPRFPSTLSPASYRFPSSSQPSSITVSSVSACVPAGSSPHVSPSYLVSPQLLPYLPSVVHTSW